MAEPVKRGPGRPKMTYEEKMAAREKRLGIKNLSEPTPPPKNLEPKATPKAQFKQTAKPNWEGLDPFDTTETVDRFHIDRSLIPEGFDLQWVTSEVFGQPEPGHRADFERKGWTPVHQHDFQGQFNGMFMKKDAPGEITVHGTVLMYRPLEISLKAKQRDRRAALEQVMIKEAELRGGDIGVTLDARHPTAVNSNRVNRTFERLDIPEK